MKEDEFCINQLLKTVLILLITASCGKDDLPTLTTLPVIEINQNSAQSGGFITNDGGSAVIARGVVWNTYEKPTVIENAGMTNDGEGTGVFNSDITGLSPGTKYYVRAYATNRDDTAYGNEFIITTLAEVIDIDGNVYQIVAIGNYLWMAENLKTTTFNDGTPISLEEDNASWRDLTTEAYCWYDNDKAAYGDIYGALYNWYALETGKLCPSGWRIPTDAEWTKLIDYAGGEHQAGGKLKSKSGWQADGNGTDNYGFSALPGGQRQYYYTPEGYLFNGFYGIWWSSSENDSNTAWNRFISYRYADVYKEAEVKNHGLSVRCIKDLNHGLKIAASIYEWGRSSVAR